jgi:hypothetical protein
MPPKRKADALSDTPATAANYTSRDWKKQKMTSMREIAVQHVSVSQQKAANTGLPRAVATSAHTIPTLESELAYIFVCS